MKVVEGTGREASVPSLRSLRSMPSAVGADVQASARGQAMSEGKLDSIAAVQAKLNMHAAYEEDGWFRVSRSDGGAG